MKIGYLKIKIQYLLCIYRVYVLWILFFIVFTFLKLFLLFQIESSVPSQLLESVLLELKGLQEFLDRNSQFTGGPLGNPK